MAFGASIVVSTVLLVRMLTLINRAAHGLADAAKRTDTAMEAFVGLRSWGILRHGEVGCLTHAAAGRGMVRALDFLVQNGANPSAMDSTGKTPLEIAQEAGMTEACDYLEALTGGRQQRPSIPLIAPPIAQKLTTKASRPRSARTLAEVAGGELAGEEVEGRSLTSGWKKLRKVVGTVVRWVGKSEKGLARGARGRVGVEPRDPCAPLAAAAPTTAVALSGRSPSQSVLEGVDALLVLPPALRISCPKHDGGMLASGIPSASSFRPLSPESFVGSSEHGRSELNAKGGSRPSSATPRATACRGERGAMATAGGEAASDHSELTRVDGEIAGSRRSPTAGPGQETSSCDARRGWRAGGADIVKGEERVREGAGKGEEKSGTGTSAREDGNREQVGDGGSASKKGRARVDKAEGIAEIAISPSRSRRSSLTRRLSVKLPQPIRRFLSDDDGTAGTGGGGGGATGKLGRSEELLAAKATEAFSRSSSPNSRLVSATLRRSLSSVRAMSPPKAAGTTTTYSPTQAVLNIAWALRRLRPLGTPRERRVAFKNLRESSPVDIPQMFLLAFVDLAALGEIPRRTGDRFLGKADKKPVTVCELMARAGESGEDPVVVYVSHRWLEPDFKNPDDHSKARFYQARNGRSPCLPRWCWC